MTEEELLHDCVMLNEEVAQLKKTIEKREVTIEHLKFKNVCLHKRCELLKTLCEALKRRETERNQQPQAAATEESVLQEEIPDAE